MSAQLSAPPGASANTALPVARNLAQVIATRLLRASGVDLARLLEKDESVISRLRSGERSVNVVEWLKVIDFLGYKLVSKEKECIPSDELRILRRCYAQHHEVLEFDDPE